MELNVYRKKNEICIEIVNDIPAEAVDTALEMLYEVIDEKLPEITAAFNNSCGEFGAYNRKE